MRKVFFCFDTCVDDGFYDTFLYAFTCLFSVCVLVPPSIDESNVVYFRKVVQNRTIVIECPVSGQILIIVIISDITNLFSN